MAELEIEVAPEPTPAFVRLRTHLRSAAEVAGRLDLPVEACTARFGDPDRLWLGPDQWLLASTTRTATELIESVAAALGDLRHQAVDFSAAVERIVLRGAPVRRLLAMGCGIDVVSLQIGACVRTRFAGIAVVMLVREQHAFDLLVDRSYARYLAAWLERAAGDPLVAA